MSVLLRTEALFDTPTDDWQARLDQIVAMMRELSLQTDPESMVRAYGKRTRELFPSDRLLALSRRDLEAPRFRITRDSARAEPINPWTQKDRLPLMSGGLLADLIYGDQPRVINDLRVDPEDPAAPYLEGMRSLMALPNYDQGHSLNMVVTLRAEPEAFDPATLPERVWMSNLFGRATNSLVLKEQLRRAYDLVDRELKVVAAIQQSLLPRTLPEIPRLGLAAHYQTSQWAGGDYYDVFELADGRWGLLIADVSGHGTPAAVMMAITHAIAHSHPGHPEPPSTLLRHVNDRLTRRYTADNGAFVTAFYGIFDPARLELTYAVAGHNPPRLRRCSSRRVDSLDAVGGLPLGLFEDLDYEQATVPLTAGDQLILYTDGIVEGTDGSGSMFGLDRLDAALARCLPDAESTIGSVLEALDAHTGGRPAEDDRTMLIGKVR